MPDVSISIIVPVFNVESYVEDCLRSVMRQTYTGPMECIIVDDCGTDNSMQIVERLIAEYKGPINFKILHHTHNRGISTARNTGMDAATGEYLFFIDSDDELTEDCLEVLSKPLAFERYDIVTSDFDRVKVLPSGNREVIIHPFKLTIQDNTLFKQPAILRSYRFNWDATAWNKLCKRRFLSEYNLRFKEGIIHEDNLWGFQVACLASTLYSINKVTYLYKIRRGSIMDSPTLAIERAAALTEIIKEMSRFVQQHNLDNRDTFPFFDLFFQTILNTFSETKSCYISKYRELRPFIMVSLKSIYHNNHFSIKGWLRAFHYFLPTRLAPHWEFLYYFHLRPSINDLINKKKEATA